MGRDGGGKKSESYREKGVGWKEKIGKPIGSLDWLSTVKPTTQTLHVFISQLLAHHRHWSQGVLTELRTTNNLNSGSFGYLISLVVTLWTQQTHWYTQQSRPRPPPHVVFLFQLLKWACCPEETPVLHRSTRLHQWIIHVNPNSSTVRTLPLSAPTNTQTHTLQHPP